MKTKTIKLKELSDLSDLSKLQNEIDKRNRWWSNITNMKNYKKWSSTPEQQYQSAERFARNSFYGALGSHSANLFF